MANDQENAAQPWGTLEELLLVCAVNRHGIESWDSIAMEVQNRTSSFSSLTPQNCRDKFNDLKRRFSSSNDADSTSLLLMVDQLRQIRVQELRAEVQRRDVSIVSLELKVKRLKEERERSSKTGADLDRDPKASPDIVAGKTSAVDGDSDDRDNRSFNESNSTNQKAETNIKNQNDAVGGGKEAQAKTEPEPENERATTRTGEGPDRDRDWSSNGKLEVNGNGKDGENDKKVSAEKLGSLKGKTSESNDLWDESKREVKEAGAVSKQSSDVQSSASLSKKKRRRNEGGGGGGGGGGGAVCGGGEEPEVEEMSPATKKKLAVKSEPLIRILEMIRSHRLGSQFERRLRSQESERYKKLIRQHIDLRTIRSRVERGLYSDSLEKFFRDLLLLFNNFLIFFRKTSQEYAAALQLRSLVRKEMSEKLRKKPKAPPAVDKQHASTNSQSNRTSTIVACGGGLRSSVKAKAAADINATAGKKGDNKKKERDVQVKPKVNQKKIEDLSLGSDDQKSTSIKKKRSDERVSAVSGRRNPRSSSSNNSKSVETMHKYGGNELSSHDVMMSKKEKDKRVKTTSNKKQGAASFLKRMKQNSPSDVVKNEKDEDEEDEDEDADASEDNGSKDGEEEEEDEDGEVRKKSRGKKNEMRRITRSSRGGRSVNKEGSGKSRRAVAAARTGAAKRSAAVASGSPPETRMGKRGRENNNNNNNNGGGKTEVVGRSRKRTRR